jgi:hypothetical protein
MTLPRYIELQWQREVVERWLNIQPALPFDVRSGLLDMLSMMQEEIEIEKEKEKLEAANDHLGERTNRRTS